MMLATLVFSTFAAGFVAPALVRRGVTHAFALVPATLFLAFLSWWPEVTGGEVILQQHAWIPSLGVSLSLRLDGLSLLFALLITGIGTGIYLYAASYLRGSTDLPRFFAFLTLFMGAMLGAVLADDLIALLVFWELTSLTSFLLIGYEPEKAASRRAAQQGLLITVAGGLCLLAGIVLLGTAAGSLRITDILAQGPMLLGHPLTPAIIVLVALGAFAKSAQAPLHAWLANAMAAPTPVSAFLHSATMVKLGVYLLARMNPALGEHPLWSALLVPVGLLTMVTGTLLALRASDLKRVLAYSTVVSLGTLVMLIGLPHPMAATAVVTFLLAHALYKASLFMVAGIVDHATGTRDASRLGGLARTMPVTTLVVVMAGLSMAGLPPFVGFIGKELIYEVALGGSWWPLAVALLANVCMVVVAGVVAGRCFFGTAQPTPSAPHDPGATMWVGPMVLAALGLLFGLMPQWPAALLAPAASAVAGHGVELQLSLWHGFTPMLALSGLTLALGGVALACWPALRRRLAGCASIDRWGTDAAYDQAILGLQRVATWQTRRIQTGSLRRYLGTFFAFTAICLLLTLWLRGGFAVAWPDWDEVGPEVALPLLLVLASAAVLRAASFMAGIVTAGMVGFLVALTFLYRGAPDLAFTQFSVEALAIVILLAIVGRMPFHEVDPRRRSERQRDAVIAAGFGLVATLVLLAVVATPFDARLSDFFRTASVPEAHGRNLVNVIIVDFRALDTLGEIAVLALAALAAAAVISSVRARQADDQEST
ncbi:cation:proton antiporter [Hydrogenophaga sp. IBVHS1]|nr:cation:proton antiporter [Hydrogenophaga sp. IBVHS1]